MNSKEFYQLFKAVDKSKYELFYNEKIGLCFAAVTPTEEEWLHTFIGTGEQQTHILLGILYDMWDKVKDRLPAEEYAETIKLAFLKFVELKSEKPKDEGISDISSDNHSEQE